MGLYDMCFKPEIDKVEMEAWDETRKTAPPLLFHPEATFKKYWDIGSVVLILYSCCSVPYFLAMGNEPVGLLIIWDRLVDILFITDIFLNFITARFVDSEDGPVLVTGYGGIASLYAQGWFLPDFLSSFPFDLLVSAIYPPEDVNPEAIRMAKLGRILRMLKILRMVRIKKLLTKLQYALGLKNGAVDIVQFFMFIVFAAHFNACAFYVRGESDNPRSWTRGGCFTTPLEEVAWDEFYSYKKGYLNLMDYDEDFIIRNPDPDAMSEQAIADELSLGVIEQFVPMMMWKTDQIRQLKPFSFDADPMGCGCAAPDSCSRPDGDMTTDCETGFTQGDAATCPAPCVFVESDGNLEQQCVDKPNAYWATFYWSIVTMTTVGYGDYYPITTDERYYCLWAMGISAVVFAFAMTSICTFIINLNTNEVYKQNRFDELIGYMGTCKVDAIFQRRCIDYFGWKTGDKSMAAYYNLDMITSEEFKTVAAGEIFESCYETWMRAHCPLANACTHDLFRDICRHLHLNVYGPKDTICASGVPGVSDMHVLCLGKMAIIHPRTKEFMLGHQVYGTQAMFGLNMYPSSVEALDFCDVYSISAVVFKECLENVGMNILQFEVDLRSRGTYDKAPPYLTLYDDWAPHGEECSPHLGDHSKDQFKDLTSTLICKQPFPDKGAEHLALQEFDQRQRAYISVLLMNKRKFGKAEAPTAVEPLDQAGSSQQGEEEGEE